MGSSEFDLEKLLRPVPSAQFLRETWERQPLAIQRKAKDYFAGLFSITDVDSIIAFSRPQFVDVSKSSLSLSNCIQGYHPEQIQTAPDSNPGISQLGIAYGEGKTVIIRGMQHRWPAIARLCRNLEAVFHCPVHGNLYLTPPHSQGFDAHIDPHEVFAIQLEGHKRWRLYGQTSELPLPGDSAFVPRSLLGPQQDILLEPGDVLYIPRGHAHDAVTSDVASLHLTVGINIYRWLDLMQQALIDISRRDPRLRESLPPGALLNDVAKDLGPRFRELLKVVMDDACIEEAATRLGDIFLDQSATLPRGHFAAMAEVESLHQDTELAQSPGMISRLLVGAEIALIKFPGGQVGGPARIAPALEFIARSKQFAVRDLPDSMGEEGKVVLAKRLVREGFLTICPQMKESAFRASTTPVNGAANDSLLEISR